MVIVPPQPLFQQDFSIASKPSAGIFAFQPSGGLFPGGGQLHSAQIDVSASPVPFPGAAMWRCCCHLGIPRSSPNGPNISFQGDPVLALVSFRKPSNTTTTTLLYCSSRATTTGSALFYRLSQLVLRR